MLLMRNNSVGIGPDTAVRQMPIAPMFMLPSWIGVEVGVEVRVRVDAGFGG